jgi:septation ring formation regulator EzrA
MARDPNNRSSLQETFTEKISWGLLPQEFSEAIEVYDKLTALLDLVETKVISVKEEVEKFPESFDGDGDYVEFDSVIEQLSEICDMMY